MSQFRLPYFSLPLSTVTPDTPQGIEEAARPTWGSKIEFILSCVGMSVGLGNIWRFPYIAYVNGGAAFLIPYVILLIIIGKPMYFAECVLGQFVSLGPIGAFSMMPFLKGIGAATAIASILIAVYYNMFMVYCTFYFFSCFQSELPWSKCSIWWGADENCYVRGENLTLPLCSTLLRPGDNMTPGITCRHWQTASEQYWRKYVLRQAEDININNIGELQWKLSVCLLFNWIVIFLCLIRGIKTSGKVVYFTAIFPYVVLLILLILGLILDGAMDGLYFLFVPEWRRLEDINTWQKAATQMFFSLNVAYGGIIVFSSYNSFYNKVDRDALLVTTLDTITSLISSIVIFSILGHMAKAIGAKVNEVSSSGPGLTFITIPEAFIHLPVPQLWCVLFFLMLFFLGLDSEFAYVETFLTSMYDQYELLRHHKALSCFVVCVISFFISLPCTTQGGMYVIDIFDVYAAGSGILLVAFFELVAVFWIYGIIRFTYDIQFMLGFIPNVYWKVCWVFLDPFILLILFILSMMTFQPVDSDSNYFPEWAQAIGWMLTLTVLIQIPLWAIWAVIRQFKKKEPIKNAFRIPDTWGPADKLHKRVYDLFIQHKSNRMKEPTASDEGNLSVEMEEHPEEMEEQSEEKPDN